jgi:hypothetical protein
VSRLPPSSPIVVRADPIARERLRVCLCAWEGQLAGGSRYPSSPAGRIGESTYSSMTSFPSPSSIPPPPPPIWFSSSLSLSLAYFDKRSQFDRKPPSFNQVKPKNDVEARVYEVLSHKNWGASTTLMNEISQDTFDYERCEFRRTGPHGESLCLLIDARSQLDFIYLRCRLSSP